MNARTPDLLNELPQRTPRAQEHFAAACLVAKQLAERTTRERVRAWAYHMKAMLADKG